MKSNNVKLMISYLFRFKSDHPVSAQINTFSPYSTVTKYAMEEVYCSSYFQEITAEDAERDLPVEVSGSREGAPRQHRGAVPFQTTHRRHWEALFSLH